MAYRFETSESFETACQRILREEMDGAVGQLKSKRQKAAGEGVHNARKSIKKIRALIALCGDKKADRAFREAGRALSDSRDALIVRETFKQLAAEHPEIAGRRPPFPRGKPDAAAARALAIERLSAAPSIRWVGSRRKLGEALSETYRSGRRHRKRLAKHPSTEGFHDLRKAAKEHWYHLRLLEGYGGSDWKQRADAIHRLEGLLGHDHDLAVLRGMVSDPKVQAIIDGKSAEVRREALALAAELYADKTRSFARTLAKATSSLFRRENSLSSDTECSRPLSS